MDESNEYSMETLEKFSYRSLQQVAKSLSLPCNVKKIYLVQLIHAKKNLTESAVDDIIQQVKLDRQLVKDVKKKSASKNRMNVQGTEISSTHNGTSPSISSTPKRRCPELRCRPASTQRHSVKKSCPIKQSDRVLRSCNVKIYKRPNYSIMNSMFGIDKEDGLPKNQVSIIHSDGSEMVVSKRVVTKYRPSVLASSLLNTSGHKMFTYARRQSTSAPPNQKPPVFTVQTRDAASNYNYVKSIVRGKDGKISQINALVQKSKNNYIVETPSSQSSYRTTFQDLINASIDNRSLSKNESLVPESSRSCLECIENFSMVTETDSDDSYPRIFELDSTEANPSNSNINVNNDMSKLTSINQSEEEKASNYPQISKEETGQIIHETNNNEVSSTSCDIINGGYGQNLTEIYTNYPSLTKLTETITYQQPQLSKIPDVLNNNYIPPTTNFTDGLSNNMETDFNATLNGDFPVYESLPHINDAFSRFNNFKDENRPLYSQANFERGRLPYMATSPVQALESLVNLRNDWILARAGNTEFPNSYIDNTKVVYCTSFVATPVPHAVSMPTSRPPSLSTTESCMEYEDLGATVTIPEMMEDALELVSQDGDYMERLGLDERMQCLLCDWAGPKFMLEIHVKKKHTDDMEYQTGDEWTVTFRLGAIAGTGVWVSRVMQRRDVIYALSVKYDDPDCLMASLTTLSTETPTKTGSITVYNKVNGEPHTWVGFIQDVPSDMPYENHSDCLKLQISKLDLIPNSANLKLLNRQLVLTSPTKAVVGRPELDNIQVSFFVKISD